MQKIMCEQLKVPDKDFNEGTVVWFKALEWVDSLYVKYDMKHGVKDLFYALIKTGAAKSVDAERILFVEKVLIMEGFKPVKED